MSKSSRLKHPSPNKEVRIQLTPREFQDLQGAIAITAVKVQAIQQDAAQRIAEVQKTSQNELIKLTKKYRVQGMKIDVNYAFDEKTHSLVEVRS